MHRISWRLAAALPILAVVACRPDFKLKDHTTNEALYAASFTEYQHNRWDNAISGFEKLTTDLPARDTLLPRSYWYLATAHERTGEHLLAAQSFGRLFESFQDDSLADDAALEAARSYRKLWRKPQLDPVNGETAMASYNTLIGLYPTSPLIPQAQKEIADLEDWFAQKDYDAGMYYFRRKAWDSGILYFKDALTKFATTPTARRAALRLVESYKSIKYREDAAELCAQLTQRYADDREVRNICAGVSVMTAAKPDSVPAAKKDSVTPPKTKPPL
ncbi:MAG TPA: outer membrane protein assembly factor BamD [Gemmatimonadaceae bacterium]|nr:outer membrane protein assembly factor BamD [Gemmatimonadaceae bacterium]